MHTLIPLLVLSLAAPAAAQLTEKQAVADVKAMAKIQMAAFKAAGKSALVQLDADLKLIEALYTPANTPEDVASSCASAGIDFVTAMNEALDQAVGTVDAGVHLALTDLGGAQPAELLVGHGGALDEARAGFLKTAAKQAVAARKRLGKFAALAGKQWDKGLSFDLRFPASLPDGAPSVAGLGGISLGAVLDLLVGCSALDAADDACLVVAGCTENTFADPDVELGISGQGSGTTSADPDAGTGRFQATFGGTGSPLAEGNYSAWAKQGNGPFATSSALGVR